MGGADHETATPTPMPHASTSHHRDGPAEQVHDHPFAFAQPLAALAHQVWPGLKDAERYALGVGAEASYGLPECQGQ